MAKIVVLSGPVSAEREDEYNKWYDEVHLPEMCAVEGVVAAQRFAAAEEQPLGEPLAPYVAFYELGDDTQAALKAVTAAAATFNMSDAIDLNTARAFVVEEHGDRYEPEE